MEKLDVNRKVITLARRRGRRRSGIIWEGQGLTHLDVDRNAVTVLLADLFTWQFLRERPWPPSTTQKHGAASVETDSTCHKLWVVISSPYSIGDRSRLSAMTTYMTRQKCIYCVVVSALVVHVNLHFNLKRHCLSILDFFYCYYWFTYCLSQRDIRSSNAQIINSCVRRSMRSSEEFQLWTDLSTSAIPISVPVEILLFNT